MKETIKQNKKTAYWMKEDICKWQFDMELISKIYKEHL